MKLAGWLVTLGLLSGPTQVYNFDSSSPGKIPPGWSVQLVQNSPPPKWEILKDKTAPSQPYVLAQVSRSTRNPAPPVLILDKAPFSDGVVSVLLKPVKGRDAAAGLVWRYKGPNDYYLVRANALENNIVVYKVEDGVQTALTPKKKSEGTLGVRYPVPEGRWSTLKVDFHGPVFNVYFNHRRVLQVEDSSAANSGKVGLWTKAGSLTYFDDFRVGER